MQIISRRATVTSGYDPDTTIWINGVEVADGAILPIAYKVAVDNLVKGLKQDNHWALLRQILIPSSAATIAGAMVALKGVNSINNGFVLSDYNRKTGFLGAANKWIDTNTAQNLDPQNNYIAAVHATAIGTGTTSLLGINVTAVSGISSIQPGSNPRCRTFSGPAASITYTPGFIGISRTSSANFTLRNNSANTVLTATSETPSSLNTMLYRMNVTYGIGNRIILYLTGQAIGIDLAQLQVRTTEYANAIAAA